MAAQGAQKLGGEMIAGLRVQSWSRGSPRWPAGQGL